MKYKILIIIAIVAFYSCTKLDNQVDTNELLIVESYIYPGDSLFLKTQKQILYGEESSIEYLEDLDIYIKSDSTNIKLQYLDTGCYFYTGYNFDVNKEYSLNIEYNDELIKASTLIPEKPSGLSTTSSTIEVFSFASGPPSEMPDPVEISWDNPNDDYFLVVVECIEEDPTLVNEEAEDRPPMLFRNSPIKGTSQVLNQRNFSYLGKHRVVLYKLNLEYALLYEQLDNGILDIQTPPTNVVNGLGIFTGVNSDTLNINVVNQ